MRLRRVMLVTISLFAIGSTATPQDVTAGPSGGAFWAVSTRNLQTMTDWYARVFELRLLRQIGTSRDVPQVRILGNDRLLLELVSHPQASSRQPENTETYLTHGFFKAGVVVDDAAAFARRLELLQVPVRHALMTSDELRIRYLIVADPEGNLIQVSSRF